MSQEAALDFGLGEMADTIRETTHRFASDKIQPIAAEMDETDEFPRQLWPQMGELGLHGITVEEEWGGLGLGYLEHDCKAGRDRRGPHGCNDGPRRRIIRAAGLAGED